MPLAHDILLLHEAGPDRQALASYLDRQGLTTTVCDETRQALAHLGTQRQSRTTLVLAHQKRVAAAPQAAVDALRAHPSILIVPTGSEPIPGFDEIVREPFFLDQLVTAIHRTMTRGRDSRSTGEAPARVDPPSADLLRGIAHAINNPLTAALGWLRLLETEMDERDRATTLVGQARAELERLSHLSQGLALLAIPTGAESVFDLAAMVGERVNAAVLTGARLTLRPRPPGRLAVSANSAEFDVMLRLILGAAHESQSVEPVEVAVSATNGMVELAIKDPRATVPEKDALLDLGRLFRVERHGRALALALAQSIARRTGGTLRCEAAHPRGATFLLSIPEAARARQAGQEAR